MVKSFLPKHTAAEKRGNARKTEILRAFGGRLMRRSHAPKRRALPAAPHPEVCKIFNFCGCFVSGQICGQKYFAKYGGNEKGGEGEKTKLFGGGCFKRLPRVFFANKILIILTIIS